ncbi:MAG: hypothetical protein ACREQV_14010 [Candidatus Binatia bacterium]
MDACCFLDSGADAASGGDELVGEVKLLGDGQGVGEQAEGEGVGLLHEVAKRCQELLVGLRQPDAISSTQDILSLTVTVTVTKAARVLA